MYIYYISYRNMIVNISSVTNDMKCTHMIKRLSIILGIEHRLPTFGLNVTCKQGQKLSIRKYVKVLIRSEILKVIRSRNLSMIHKWFYVTLKVVLYFFFKSCFHNVSFQERRSWKGLMWPSMTFAVILNFMKKLWIHNVIMIHTIYGFDKIIIWTKNIPQNKGIFQRKWPYLTSFDLWGQASF